MLVTEGSQSNRGTHRTWKLSLEEFVSQPHKPITPPGRFQRFLKRTLSNALLREILQHDGRVDRVI